MISQYKYKAKYSGLVDDPPLELKKKSNSCYCYTQSNDLHSDVPKDKAGSNRHQCESCDSISEYIMETCPCPKTDAGY